MKEHPLESEIENKFTPYAAEFGCLAKKLVIEGSKGWPDRFILCPMGHIFFIEFKRPTGSESVHQEIIRKFLIKLGFNVYVIDSLQEAKEVLAQEITYLELA